ncbi:MAG TPA: glycosyltransferase family 4 protein, partial [Chthoniobacteraceae bacterium]|nr:glycosyltransferase family 4 protein [Chthoniobacteraceae bacterium]
PWVVGKRDMNQSEMVSATLRNTFKDIKVAIVHDWLPLYGGAERVLEQMLYVCPQADIYSMIDAVPEEQRSFLQGKKVTTSFIQKLPFGKKKYRGYLPLMPLAVEQFDLSLYDVVISSSYAVAKGVLTGPDQLHICFCHSPIRYAWDLQHEYLAEAGVNKGVKGWITRALLHYIRLWDSRTAHGVDYFVANSHYIGRRIRKAYGRSSSVIYPPVDTAVFAPVAEKEDYYVTASRFVPYKKIRLVVEAFARMPGRTLHVLGDGPSWKEIASKATPNVRMLGYQDPLAMISQLQKAKAFVYAAQEDFGILPVEAQACGTPVIAYGKGGATETVINGTTGILFPTQTVEGICWGVDQFERQTFDSTIIRANAERFSVERFRKNFGHFVQGAWDNFCAQREAAQEELMTNVDALNSIPAKIDFSKIGVD